MIDLHSHVLFDIDDGAGDIESSEAIIRNAKEIGIDKIMATPHFTIGDDVDDFIIKRDSRAEMLNLLLKNQGIDVRLETGAEIYITDEIFNENMLHQLTLGNSDYVLTEFKYHGVRPEKFLEYIDYILNEGLKVLIAHVERYSFVRKNPYLINELKIRDVKLQVNAISLFEQSEEGEFAYFLLRNRLIDALGSDIHHVPSKRYEAMKKLSRSENEYIQFLLTGDGLNIFK